MTDRETLVKVSTGYRQLIVANRKQKALFAQCIRLCLVQLRSKNIAKRKEALSSLETLADMLEGK